MAHFRSRVLEKVTILFKEELYKFAPGKFQAIFNLIDIHWFAKVTLGPELSKNLTKLLVKSTGNQTCNKLNDKNLILPLRWMGFKKLLFFELIPLTGDNGVARKRMILNFS